jgi:hypothetical protein
VALVGLVALSSQAILTFAYHRATSLVPWLKAGPPDERLEIGLLIGVGVLTHVAPSLTALCWPAQEQLAADLRGVPRNQGLGFLVLFPPALVLVLLLIAASQWVSYLIVASRAGIKPFFAFLLPFLIVSGASVCGVVVREMRLGVTSGLRCAVVIGMSLLLYGMSLPGPFTFFAIVAYVYWATVAPVRAIDRIWSLRDDCAPGRQRDG